VKDRSGVDRLLTANRYLVLATADEDGRPWATPLFFGLVGSTRVCWVSAPDRRHSRNLVQRPAVAITVFDSTVEVGHAEAAYFDAEAATAEGDDVTLVLAGLNARLPEPKQLGADDLRPDGRLVAYTAELRRWYLLARGGDPETGNDVDLTVEV
jgi:hypothetical protein